MGGGGAQGAVGPTPSPSRCQEATAVLSARRAEEVTQEGLSRALAQLAPAAAPSTRRTPPTDSEELVVSGAGKRDGAGGPRECCSAP